MEPNIYNPPEADLESGNPNIVASRWSRLGASIVDGITIAVILYPLMYLTGGFDGFADGTQLSLGYSFAVGVFSLLIFFIIHGKILIRDGQSWGKKILGIKIVTMEGAHASKQELAKRYGFYFGIQLIPIVGPLITFISILFIFGKATRCGHDYVAKTKVVKVSN